MLMLSLVLYIFKKMHLTIFFSIFLSTKLWHCHDAILINWPFLFFLLILAMGIFKCSIRGEGGEGIDTWVNQYELHNHQSHGQSPK